MKTEHPILFSGEMIKAILEGRKTQTRRVLKTQPDSKGVVVQTPGIETWYIWPTNIPIHQFLSGQLTTMLYKDHYCKCPYGVIGDRLWIRESFQLVQPWGSVDDEWIGDDNMEWDGQLPKTPPTWWSLLYKVDEPEAADWWRPSIFMPRWASRIMLEITDIRVQRLQDITESDALAEGVLDNSTATFIAATPRFGTLWNSINAKRGYGWDTNPWVWVIEFKRIE